MTSPIVPPAKRRRLLQSSQSLAKPFKSPLRPSTAVKPLTQPTSTDENQRESTAVGNPHVPSVSQPHTSQAATYPEGKFEAPTSITSTSPRQLRPVNNVTSVQEQNEASKLASDLDTIRQAEKIEASGKNDELQALIDKWRAASRELAEEAFRAARDRVNRMGGVGAWRASKRRPSGWDEQDEEGHLERLTDEQREAFEIAKEELMADTAKYGTTTSDNRSEEEDDEVCFTLYGTYWWVNSHCVFHAVSHYGHDAGKPQY